MADSLRDRVAHIIMGSAHALLDKIEEQAPEAMMEQALRRIEGVIDEVRAELGKAAANRHLAQQKHAELNRRHLEATAQAEEALQLNREDLARIAITRQLDVEAQIPVIEASLSEMAANEKELSGYVEALLSKKRDMQETLAQYAESRKRAAQPSGAGTGAGSSSASTAASAVDKASDAFERVLRTQTGLSMAAHKVSAEETLKLKELDALVQDKRIEARLAQLKQLKANKQ